MRTDVATTVAATLGAIVAGVLARALLGWDHPVALLFPAYATFVVITATRPLDTVRRARTAGPSTGPAAYAPRAYVPTAPAPSIPERPALLRPEPPEVVPEPDLLPGVVGDDPNDDEPRRFRHLGERDAWQAGTALAVGLALSITVRVLLDWDGVMGTLLWAFIGFLVVHAVLVWDQAGQEAAADRTVTVLVWAAALGVLAGLVWMLGLLLVKGLPRLRPSFFTQDLSTVGPNDPGGGALHAIIGTLQQVGIAVVVVVPIAVLTAVYLHELKGRMAPVIRFVVDAMSGLPSIVAGLLVFTVWVDGRGFSGLAGSAALVVLMIPTVTRTSEEILRTIPDSLREASLALGAPRWRVVLRVVVPTAMSGLVTATILGVARAIGETAPMLLTAFGSDSINANPNDGPQADLPLFVWKLIRVPNEVQNARGWTGALVLVLLVLFLFVTARLISNHARKRLGSAR